MYFHMSQHSFSVFCVHFLDHLPKVHTDCQKGTLLLYDLKFIVQRVRERHLDIPTLRGAKSAVVSPCGILSIPQIVMAAD